MSPRDHTDVHTEAGPESVGCFGTVHPAFVSLRDNLDLSTPSGRLMFQIIGAMAEFERSPIVERVKAGMRSAGAKRKRMGQPPRTPLSPDMRKTIAGSPTGINRGAYAF